MTDYIKLHEEKIEEAIKRDEEASRRQAEEKGAAYVEPEPVPDLTDGINAVDEEGRIDEQNAPADPNARDESGERTEQPRATQETPAPKKKPSVVLSDIKDFEGKKHSFFSPDEEKGFWGTLDKKVQEALQGNSPEDIGVNMFLALMTCACDMVGNYATHLRKERKRLEKEYKENTAKNDEILGIAQSHKNLAIWAVIANHPAMEKYAGKTVDKEMKKAVYNLYRSDKEAQKAAILLISSMCGRKLTRDEANTYFEKAFKAELGDATLEDVKNAALNNEKVLAGLELSGLKDEVFKTHAQVDSHAGDVANNQADRDSLNRARQGQQTQTQTRTRTQGRDAA